MKRPFFFGLVAIVVCAHFPSAVAAQNASAYVNLGFSYYKLGKYDDAVEQFEKALALDKDLQNVYGLLGSAFFQMGDMDKAIEAYKKQIELTPRLQIIISTLASSI